MKDKRCIVENGICIYRYKSGVVQSTNKPSAQNSYIVSNPCNPPTVLDIDGNVYNTVKIGNQCWMKENLKVTKSPEGRLVDRDCYNNDPNICDTDGGLYSWLTVMNIIITSAADQKGTAKVVEGVQGICPNGWHVPKDSEWHILENYLKDSGNTCESTRRTEGGKIKIYVSYGDEKPVKDDCFGAATKLIQNGSSGFEAIMAGYVLTPSFSIASQPKGFWYNGYFYEPGYHNANGFSTRGTDTYFWSSTGNNQNTWTRQISPGYGVARLTYKGGGLSVRCLKN